MNGDLKQRQREAVIKQLKQRRLRIVVATDVAARGLDIKDLSHVVNYDMPSKDATFTVLVEQEEQVLREPRC